MVTHEEEGLQILIFLMCLWVLHEMLPTPKTKCPRLSTFDQKLTYQKGFHTLDFPSTNN